MTAPMTPPIAGAEFHGYARATPEGDWPYVIDDFGIVYGRGAWPFRSFTGCDGNGRAHYAEDASVRLAPGVDYYAWGNEYVTLYAPHDGMGGFGDLRLWVAPQGMGGWIYHASFDIEVPSFECTFDAEPPPELAAQGATKLARITALLRAEASRRDAGKRAPVTAYDLYQQRQRAAQHPQGDRS